jgi:phosphatidylethanolamine-binding protein (PEBP) family uncharacterized protein
MCGCREKGNAGSPAARETQTKADLLKAMQGHILDQGELMGKYSK